MFYKIYTVVYTGAILDASIYRSYLRPICTYSVYRVLGREELGELLDAVDERHGSSGGVQSLGGHVQRSDRQGPQSRQVRDQSHSSRSCRAHQRRLRSFLVLNTSVLIS